MSFDRLRVRVLLAGLLATGCGDLALEDVAPESIPALPTYAVHIQPIVSHYCVPCHSETTRPGKRGEESDQNYTTYEGTVAGYHGIETNVLKKDKMPPGAARRVTSWEKAVLVRWSKVGYPP